MTGTFSPFENESDSVQIGGPEGITVENRVDRVSLYGSLDITRDKQGLAFAKAIHEILTRTILRLEADPDLPDDAAPPQAPSKTNNPFRG